jgi:RNA polymerase sigma factor (sigma-70 family)
MTRSARDQRSAEFNALFTATHARVIGYVLRRGAGPADADDVVADVYLVAWRRFDDIPPADPLPWLLGVARNVHRNQQRSRRRGDALLQRLRAESRSGEVTRAVVPSDIATIRRALAALSESDRELLQLAAVEQLSPAQIAQVLRCQPVTVRVRLHRARTRLRAQLELRAHDDGAAGYLAVEPSERSGA